MEPDTQNVGKFEPGIFRPTVANISELEVCLYFFPIDEHVLSTII